MWWGTQAGKEGRKGEVRGRWVVGDKDELMSGCWCRGHVEISGSPLDFGAQRPAVRCGPGRGVRRDTDKEEAAWRGLPGR